MANRKRYSDKLRWLFVVMIVALLGSAVLNPASPNLSGGLRPYAPASSSKVYAEDINVQAAPSDKAAPPASVIVSGRVYDAVTTTVAIPSIVNFNSITATTDNNGNYTISIDPGSYNVSAVPNDHCYVPNNLGQISITGTMTLDFPINHKIDQFGHFCRTETGNWIPGTTQITLDQNGYYSTTLPSDFNFTFFGLLDQTNRQVNIYNYGFLNFGNRHDTGISANSSIPNNTPPDNAIYGWWSNLTVDMTSTLYTKLDSSDPSHRKFIVEWRNVQLPYPDLSRIDFEIVIQEGTLGDNTTGNIWINYQATGCGDPNNCTQSHGLFATTGIESIPDPIAQVNDGIQYSYDEGALYNGLSAHFYLPPQGIVVGHVTDKHTPHDTPLDNATVQVLGTSRLVNTSISNGSAYTLSLGLGTYVVQASKSRYQTLTQTITLSSPGQVTTANFDLGSPAVNPVQPGYTDMWVYTGMTKTYNLAINNLGELNMPWVLREALDHNGGGLAPGQGSAVDVKSPPRQLPAWANGSLSDPGQSQPGQPASVTCDHANINIQRSYRAYDSPRVSLNPGNNQHIDYTMLTRPVGASPDITPANILLYSDDNKSLFHDPNEGDPDAVKLTYQLPVRALCALGYNANTTGFYNDPGGFWNALLHPPSGGWSIVILAVEVRQNDFADTQWCPSAPSASCWQGLSAYYDGGPNNTPPAGKVVMTTWDVSGTQLGGNTTDAINFFSQKLGAVHRAAGTTLSSIYMWPGQRSDPFYTTPYSLTAITTLQDFGYSTNAIDYMDTNDVVGACKVGYQTISPVQGRCAIVASYDGRGVIASFRTSSDVEGINPPTTPAHITTWWCNMINQVVSPPIDFGDIPWISESANAGMVPANSVNNVTLRIDATNIHTRTIIPLSGYLYLGTNDPHIENPVGIELPLSLTVLLPGDATPTPAPPPLVDLAVGSITAIGLNNDHPVVNMTTTISVNVQNLGSIGGNVPFSVDMFYDQPITPTFGTQCNIGLDPACYQSVGALNGNSNVTVNFSHIFTTPGVHRVWVIVNTDLHQLEPTQVLTNNSGGAYVCAETHTGPSFNDVATNNFAYQAVEYLFCRGIVSGISTTPPLFAPNANTTRAQFSRMIAKGFGYTLITPPTPTFNDVPTTYWAYTYIETLAAQHVVSGFDHATCLAHGRADGCFLPNNNITRGQLSVFIWKAKKLQNPIWATPIIGTHFTDVPTNYFAYTAIEILSSQTYHVLAGITTATCTARGITPPCFLPSDNGTRGQLSVMLYKALNRP